MSVYQSVAPGDLKPSAPERPRRKRFAGERLGAWLFAASFSVGIWGLALKILEPGHPATPAVPHYAILAPSGAPDGRATVLWAVDASEAPAGYPATMGTPLFTLAPPDSPTPVQP